MKVAVEVLEMASGSKDSVNPDTLLEFCRFISSAGVHAHWASWLESLAVVRVAGSERSPCQ